MVTHAHTFPVRIRISPVGVVLRGLSILAFVIAMIRFTSGIGAVSNMSDAYAWGIWISFDLLTGVALAAGAFMTAAAVYILRLEHFRPLLRPAILTGFLGYMMVIVALLVDLGRPERIWYMLIYHNTSSVLLEVGLCVMTYTTVLALEFSPLVFERLGWRAPLRWIHAITLPLVILGVVLSTLHQSSLGSLYLIMSDKLHPLWYSPLLPLFFFISAGTAGLGMVIVESSISSRSYGMGLEVHLLARLARAIPWFLGTYLALKIGELAYADELGLLWAGNRFTALFWAELAIGVLAPILIFAFPAARRNPKWLLTGGALMVTGLMVNRFNVGLLALARPTGSAYFPSWMEITVSLGIIATGVLVYDWVARHLPLFDHSASH